MHLLCILYFIYFNLHWLISSHRWHKHHIAPSKKKKIQVCVKKQANIQILNCRTVLQSVTDPLFDMWGTTNFVMRKADFTFTDKICDRTENKGNKSNSTLPYNDGGKSSLGEYVTLSQTSSVESKMFPKNGLTAALDTRISIPPHCSRVYF